MTRGPLTGTMSLTCSFSHLSSTSLTSLPLRIWKSLYPRPILFKRTYSYRFRSLISFGSQKLLDQIPDARHLSFFFNFLLFTSFYLFLQRSYPTYYSWLRPCYHVSSPLLAAGLDTLREKLNALRESPLQLSFCRPVIRVATWNHRGLGLLKDKERAVFSEQPASWEIIVELMTDIVVITEVDALL